MGSKILNYSNVIFAQTTYEKTQLNKIYGISLDKIVLFTVKVKMEGFQPANVSNVKENILKVSGEQYFI